MKTTSNIAVAILTGLLLQSAKTVHSATLSQSAGWLVLAGQVGQFNLFNSQPKQDPFTGVDQSAGGPQNSPSPAEYTKTQAAEFVRKGREALAQGNVPQAVLYQSRAAELNASFGPDEDSPAKLSADIRRSGSSLGIVADDARRLPQLPPVSLMQNPGLPQGLPPANYPTTGAQPPSLGFVNTPPPAATSGAAPNYPVQQAGGTIGTDQRGNAAVYQPANDPTYNRPASTQPPPLSGIRFAPQPAPPIVDPRYAAPARAAGAPASRVTIREVPGALVSATDGPREPTPIYAPTAPAFSRAPPSVLGQPAVAPGGSELLTEASTAEERLKRQVSAEVARQSRNALDVRARDPMGSLGMLQKTRAMLVESSLNDTDKSLMIGRVDRLIGETEKYIDQHRAEIELDQRNYRIRAELKREGEYKLEVQERLALLVDEYNKLRNEDRLYEAEAKAKEARELAPDEPVVTQMWEEIRYYRRKVNNREIAEQKEDGFITQMINVDRSAIPFDDNNPIVFAEKAEWSTLTARRRKFAGDGQRERHPSEQEIEGKLSTPISLKFQDAPLSEVVSYMKQVAGVNIYLDPMGLAEEGVDPSTPVTIDLSQQISLGSALNLILQPLSLSYVIKNEVLKITSSQLRDRVVYSRTYNVADLVIPIPDFVPHDQMGLPNALARGYDMTNRNLSGGAYFQPPVIAVAQAAGTAGMPTPDGVLAQSGGGFAAPGRPGGAAAADFDALIELVTKTIEPDSWDEVGGPGSVAEFETNLSLVISQTQEVHEKIADLLNQLRRLQDLQVTIEVRFITLRDNFFEQIGIDFDFNIDDNTNFPTERLDDSGATTTIGIDATSQPSPPGPLNVAGNPLASLIGLNDIQVRQGSFGTMPAFGGFNPAVATTFGVAILSDIEAYFLVSAAQGDNRSNITQSPKVTLFNGQAASISDQIQQPFVTSITPVVGDFAAAQAPVIVVLGEGTTLSVQAVVSPDRRFVRLTLVPFFSEIRDVDEFTFTGRTSSTRTQSDSADDGGDVDTGNASSSASSSIEFTEGTTIQLPTFAFTTVTTTVSVPDGGTVLLGGIKRLREGRNEVGTPFLSKLPYISRLFKNVGIGRETESLMLMVTPRIIIQEEEEEKLGLALP